jgi:hypothetical protein
MGRNRRLYKDRGRRGNLWFRLKQGQRDVRHARGNRPDPRDGSPHDAVAVGFVAGRDYLLGFELGPRRQAVSEPQAAFVPKRPQLLQTTQPVAGWRVIVPRPYVEAGTQRSSDGLGSTPERPRC